MQSSGTEYRSHLAREITRNTGDQPDRRTNAMSRERSDKGSASNRATLSPRGQDAIDRGTANDDNLGGHGIGHARGG